MINKEVCYAETSLNKLHLAARGFKPIELLSPSGKGKIAELEVIACHIDPIPAFTDYLREGYQIALIGAIDFTYSNGSPSNPVSLHKKVVSEEHPNQYVDAIKAVGSILH